MTTSEIVDPGQHAGEVSLLTPQAHDDVLDYFKHLREYAPVYRDEQGTYILTRYDDVYAALQDPLTYSSNMELAQSELDVANQRLLVYCDDPDHLDMRKLINRAWTPSATAELEPIIQAHADAMLTPIAPEQAFDVLPLGMTFALHCFADAMGVPAEQHDRVKSWAAAAGMFTRPKPAGPEAPLPTGDVAAQRAVTFNAGFLDMEAYFAELVDAHREHNPKYCKSEEGLPPFARAVVAAAKADPGSLHVILTRLLPPMHAGGTSTVSHIFVNAVDVLLDHPEVWTQLRTDRSHLDPDTPSEILEEILRLKSVVQGLARVTTRAVEVRGTLIPAGSRVQLYYLSGSHDPEMFEDPDEFKPRGLSRHLGFGFGTHTCMGQSFARLQLKIFLNGLLDKFTSVERAPVPVKWGGVGVYYTPDKLFVVGHA